MKRTSSTIDLVSQTKYSKISTTNYSCCVICQRQSAQPLHKVTLVGLTSLKTAAEARQDETALRLEADITSDTFLTEKKPLWHPDCRNVYTLKKSYELARRKRTNGEKSSSAQEPVCATDGASVRSTRSSSATFDAKSQCVICNKTYDREGKLPKSMVQTENRQQSLLSKAQSLQDHDLLLRIQGYTDDTIDMVASDICYHRTCINKYMAQRRKSDTNTQDTSINDPTRQSYDIAFNNFVANIHGPLFDDMCGYLLVTLRDMYREELKATGVPVWSTYRSSQLKKRLEDLFGNKIVFLPQTSGSDFVCSSSVNIGDALTKLKQLQDNSQRSDDDKVLEAARILRQTAKECKAKLALDSIEISSDAASNIVPDNILNFVCQLLVDKKLTENGKDECSQQTLESALLLSQQLLYAICNVKTPLTIGMAFDIYNNSRSKSLMTVMNRLNTSISYDTFHRQLTGIYNDIQKDVKETGLYVPPNMTNEVFTQFAIDNIDWHEKTTDGSTFHATSAIMIQPPSTGNKVIPEINIQSSESTSQPRQRSIGDVPASNIDHCRLSASEKKSSRSLAGIPSMTSIQTGSSNRTNDFLWMWRLSRMIPTRIIDVEGDEGVTMPGFSAFSAHVAQSRKANNIGYLPLIPSSPTDPAVVKKAMTECVKMSQHIGMEYTVITCDQAVYEIAFALRKQDAEQFSSVVLHLGGFHLCHNFMKAITKVMRGSGAEDLLVAAGVALEGTSHKIFGEKPDYYQTLHALKVLYEVMVSVQWESFEAWILAEDKDASCVAHLGDAIGKLYGTYEQTDVPLDETTISEKLTITLVETETELHQVQSLLEDFCDTNKEAPNFTYWSTFIDMTSILHRFLYAQREGNWQDYLNEAGNMIPYIVAAGHHKYGVYLPLYLNDMNQLPTTYPTLHKRYIDHGDFTIRRTDGKHNGVSPDMVLEQSYNADLKNKQGLSGITLNEKAQTKWLYTKPVVAAASGQFRNMLQMNSVTERTHHEAGSSNVQKDKDLVTRALQALASHMINPFTTPSTALVNIATGEQASPAVCADLTHVKEIGEAAMQKCLESGGEKLQAVRLKTFSFQGKKDSTIKRQQPKTPEVNVLHRLSQVIASGGTVDIHDMVGMHECTDAPPSLFDQQGTLRRGVKSTLVNVILDEVELDKRNGLPDEHKSTAVVVDAMHMVRKWSFLPNETFHDMQKRYKRNLKYDVPQDTDIVHFICDRYDHELSLKAIERQYRLASGHQKIFDVNANLVTPAFKDFVNQSQNKANLLKYLSESWSEPGSFGNMKLVLSGGFKEETSTFMVGHNHTSPVPELESNHEEADTRIILHVLYSFEVLHLERVVVHSNDTDVIVMCIYYASKCDSITELWVRTDSNVYLPIHEIADKLGSVDCAFLPFFHALTGKDDTSFIYGLGKKKMWKAHKSIDCSSLSQFSESPFESEVMPEVSQNIVDNATSFILHGYSGGNSCHSLAELRTKKFLSGSLGTLQSLPPTPDAFLQHLKRACLSTIVMKSAHIAKTPKMQFDKYGWCVHDSTLCPVKMTIDAFPKKLEQSVKCNCKKKCARNCTCLRNNVPCYLACSCKGETGKCTRCTETFDETDIDVNDE